MGAKAAGKHFAKTSIKQIAKGIGWGAAVNPLTGPIVGAAAGGVGGIGLGVMANDSGDMSDSAGLAVAAGMGVLGAAGGAVAGTAAGLVNPIVQPIYRGGKIVKKGGWGGIKKGKQAAKDYRNQKRQQRGYTQNQPEDVR